MCGVLVLVVDDASDIRESLVVALEFEGYSVLEARDGLEALSMAAAHRPDVIVMDMEMPQMGGLEAAQRLKQTENLEHIPVIAHTGRPQDLRPSGLFHAVLSKPCSMENIFEAIFELCRR